MSLATRLSLGVGVGGGGGLAQPAMAKRNQPNKKTRKTLDIEFSSKEKTCAGSCKTLRTVMVT
jgi:hypothetical protein